MNIRRTTHLAALALIVTLAACNTAAKRSPAENHTVADDFRARTVHDIVVLPVSGTVSTDRAGGDLPADGLREAVRDALIQRKNYAIPQSTWVDSRLETVNASPAALGTDAILTVTVNQWDTTSLQSRGVVYAGGAFVLTGATGERLWEYSCRDMMISIAASQRGAALDKKLGWAAGRLARRAIASLPSK